jgi:hypothetical protein
MFQKSKKTCSRVLRASLRSVLLAAITSGLGLQAAETLFPNSGFDANAAGWYWEDWSTPGSPVFFDATRNSTVIGGSPTSGSLKLINNFTTAPAYQQAVYTVPLAAPQDFNNKVGWISFDVKVDPSSTPRAGGDYGFLELILRQGNDWTWVVPTGVRLNGTEWQRVTFQIPKEGVDSIRAITLKLGDGDLLGPITLNVDNIAYSTNPEDVFISAADNGVVDTPPARWSWENWSVPRHGFLRCARRARPQHVRFNQARAQFRKQAE